jgi:predicted DNA binding CopG/RHH family protein
MKKLKAIPKFKNENEEDNFWSTHDSTDYFDTSKAIINPSFPNLKLSTKTITIRVTQSLLDSLKMIANKKDVPYQSLVKIFLNEKIREEFEPRVKHAP